MSESSTSLRGQVEPGHLHRLRWMALLFVLVFIGLAGRLVYIQAVDHDFYRELAERKTRYEALQEPPRGEIRDRHNRILAASRPIRRIIADPSRVGSYARVVADRIAPILDYDPAELARLLEPSIAYTNRHGIPVPRQWVNLRRKLMPEQWSALTNVMGNLRFPVPLEQLPSGQRRILQDLRRRAIFAEEEQQRHYPHGSLAAHVIGFTRTIETNFNQFNLRQTHGVYGIERKYQDQLAGTLGWRRTRVDGTFREDVTRREQHVRARAGMNVILTLDLMIQNIVESVLAEAMERYRPESASCVVADPTTGEILAMACLPSFDPNHPGHSKMAHLRNRIIADQVEPGSTFKIVVISATLNEGLYSLDDRIDCENGLWYYRNRPLRDAHAYDLLKVREVLSKSSNIGSAKLGLALGSHTFHDYVRAYGFGETTGLGLAGEVPGTVHPVRRWDGLTLSRMPIGQSVAVTHLQMVMAMAAVANEGVLMQPQLLRRIESAEGRLFTEFFPQPVRRVVSPRAARQTLQALVEVVEEGTAKKAALDHYTVGGKTGTAQIAQGGRYLSGANLHTFIGMLPASNPRLVISVMLDRPRRGAYASSTAVPTFKTIAEQTARHLGLPPDKVLDESRVFTGRAYAQRGQTR